MEFLTNKIGYSTRVSYFICTITYQQHYVCGASAQHVRSISTTCAEHQHNMCGASAQHVRSINTICANLQHIHEEQIMGDVIAKEYIGKH